MRKKLLFPVLSIILVVLLGILTVDRYHSGEEGRLNSYQENKIDLFTWNRTRQGTSNLKL